jgi:uncharacterized protein (DUF1778 family)
MTTFNAHIELDTDQLIDNLATLTHEQIKQFIIDLDIVVADVQFTEELLLALAKSMKGLDDPVDFINWEKV